MTCGDVLKIEILKYVTVMLDYTSGQILAFTMIGIMVYLLGVEGKVVRKTWIPLLFFALVAIGASSLLLIYESSILGKDLGAPFREDMLALSVNQIPNNVLRILFYISIFISGMLTFERKKIRFSALAVVLTLIFTGYLMIESLYSLIFFFEDPRMRLKTYLDKSQFLGCRFSIAFELFVNVIGIIIFIVVYAGLIKKDRKLYVRWRYRVLFVIWDVMMYILMIIPFRKGLSYSDYETRIRYELGIILPVLGLVIPVILVVIISKRFMVEKTNIQENYISAELDYLNQYKKDQADTRAFRHKIMDDLAGLSAMYSDKRYDEAGEHLSNLLGNVKAMSPRYVTGDEMLDCIVCMKSSKMDEDGIEFLLDGVLDGGLGMKPVDICTIFANALDNAIEACENLPEKSKKWIRLALKKTDRFFSITLSNTMYSKEETSFTAVLFGEGERYTTKKDRSLHGFGTQNMKATISKYDGIEKASSKDGIFTLSVIIPRSVQSVV